MENDKYIGRLLDNRYEILESIGTGGMAVVYKARCHRLNRLVAIKILKDELSQDEEFRRRFHAESQAVAMLSHPNIVSVYDVSTTDEADYIVMELIDGITLKQYMEKKGVLNWKETLHFGMQIAKALEHAHSRGIVHRDIKPHNVMVLKNGSVKVTDFGIARIMSKSNTLTKEALGSVHYISPEQAKGGRVDARSDLYSLGVVMYEMMTGRPPFDGESPVAVAIQHINGKPTMPSLINPNIPGGLEQIIMKAMEKDPAKRYASATEMLYDLEEFRKNPSILFDFNAGSLDDAARMASPIPVVPAEQPSPLPRTTAERIAAARTEHPVQPVPSVHPNPQPRPNPRPAASASPNPVPRSPVSMGNSSPMEEENRRRAAASEARRRQREEQEAQEASRNRTMTVAVVACSAIAVIGLVVLLVVLLNQGLFSRENAMIPVPDLVGEVYSELDQTKYTDLKLSPQNFEYSDTIPTGGITRQEPEAKALVKPGTELKLWISLGAEESSDIPMGDLTDQSEKNARDYLNNLKADLVVITRTEHHDEIKKGRVIRTEPAPGQMLEQGQTVTLFLSDGPALVEKNVPNVIKMDVNKAIGILETAGFKSYRLEYEESIQPKDEVTRLSVEVNRKADVETEIIIYVSEGAIHAPMPKMEGATKEEAIDLLTAAGFRNYKIEVEENEAEKNTVLRQSVAAGTEYDVAQKVVLYVSSGPKPTEPPTEPPTEATKPPEVSRNVTIALTEDGDDPFRVKIVLNGKTLYDAMVQPKTDSVTVPMTGIGVQEYEIYINDKLDRTEKVNFGG